MRAEIANSSHLENPRHPSRGWPAPYSKSFGSFPTSILDDDDRLIADHSGTDRFQRFLKQPLTNYAPNRRSADPAIIQAILSAAAQPQSLAELDELFRQHQIEQPTARATIAWMLKYSLLRRAETVAP